MLSKQKMRRMAAVSTGAAAIALIASPPAHADWKSTIRKWNSGMESRRWNDGGKSRVVFQGCDPVGLKSVGVKMRRDKSLAPDPTYGEKTFKQCAKNVANNYSFGYWKGLPKGKYYFQIGKLSGSSWVSVYYVHVTTTY